MNFFHAVNSAITPTTSAGIALEGYQLSTNASHSSTTPTSVSLPSQASAGHVCVVFIGGDNVTTSVMFNTPTGWTKQVGSVSSLYDVEVSIFTKTLTASDISAGSVIFTSSFTTVIQCGAWAMAFSGANTTSPIDSYQITSSNSGTSFTLTGTTPTYGGGYILACWGFDGGDGEPFSITTSGWTLQDEADVPPEGEGGTYSAGWGSKNTLSQTSTSTGDVSITCQVEDGKTGIVLVVRAS